MFGTYRKQVGQGYLAQPPSALLLSIKDARTGWQVLRRIRTRVTRRGIAFGRSFVADKPLLRAALLPIWRRANKMTWGARGDMLHATRRILDAAVSLRQQSASWASGADPFAVSELPQLEAVLAECLGAAGMIVSLSHDDYALVIGGTQNVIADEQRAFEAMGWKYLHISPATPSPALGPRGRPEEYRLKMRLDGKPLGIITFPELSEFLAASRNRAIRMAIVFHHLKGHVPELLSTLPDIVGARAMVWVHDFFSLCPNYSLMRNDVKFCGAPSPRSPACEVCVYGGDRQDHSPRIRAFFDAVHPAMLFPSEVARDFWLRQGGHTYAGTNVVPIALLNMARNGEPIATRAGSPLRVAHLGVSLSHKGWLVFEALATKHARDRRYKFYQFGADRGVSAKYVHKKVRVTPENRNAMIEAITQNRIDVVVCWSLWPETFCFTVHEALAGGAFVLARRAAGNVWPAVQANAGWQGHAVENETDLFDLFESGEIRALVAQSRRYTGTLRPTGNTADFLSDNERQPVIRNIIVSADQ